MLFVLLSKVVLRKIGSRDDADCSYESKGYLEIFLHSEKVNKNLLKYNKVQCLCKCFFLVF